MRSSRGVRATAWWLLTLACVGVASAESLYPGLRVPAGDVPSGVVVGDFDGDLVPDLATTNEFGDDVTVMLGNGDASFQAPLASPAGDAPIAIAAGRFDADAFLDVVTANDVRDPFFPSGGVNLLLGNGDGTFQAPIPLLEDVASRGVVAAHLDADAFLDVAVVADGELNVLRGNGDGTFQEPVVVPVSGAVFLVTAGDLDGDEIADLVTTPGSNPVEICVLLAEGDGSFQDAACYDAGDGPTQVAVADIDGDDVPDLGVTNRANSGPLGAGVSVLLGVGDGAFGEASFFPVAQSPTWIAAADFDGDDDFDLVTADGLNATAPRVNVLLSTGDGGLQPPAPFVAGTTLTAIAAADLDGDDVPDVVTTDFEIAAPAGTQIAAGGGARVFRGVGDGTFRTSIVFQAGPLAVTEPIGLEDVAAADLDDDDAVDLVVVSLGVRAFDPSTFMFITVPARVNVLLGNGDGTFTEGWTSPLRDDVSVALAVALSDLDGDGVADLIVADGGTSFSVGPVEVSVWRGNGDGTFQEPDRYPLDGGPTFNIDLDVADLDGDGVRDLATNLGTLLGTGGGDFDPAVRLPGFPNRLTIADFDEDGVPDLGTVGFRGAALLLGLGDGTFEEGDPPPAAGNRSVDAADFDADGHFDLAISGNDIEVLLGNGDGTFVAPETIELFASSVLAADANGDTVPDLVTLGGDEVCVLPGRGDGTFDAELCFAGATSGALAAALAHLDADGFVDVAVVEPQPTNGGDTLNVLLSLSGPRRTCDLDGNAATDSRDIDVIFAARSTQVVPGDPRDVDANGFVTVNDARTCALACDLANCAEVACGLLGIEPALLLLGMGWLRRRGGRRRSRGAIRGAAVALVLAAGLQVLPGSARAIQIAVLPATAEVPVSGSFLVEVVVSDLGSEIVSAYDLDLLYDDAVLTATSVVFGTRLEPSLADFVLSPGIVDFAETSLASDAALAASQPDTFTLATIAFDATGLGASALTLVLDTVNEVRGLDSQVLDVTAVGAEVTIVPEPRTLLLLGAGALVLGWWRRPCGTKRAAL